MTKVQVQTDGGAILADCHTDDLRIRSTAFHRLSCVIIDDNGVVVTLEARPTLSGGQPDFSATLAEVDMAWDDNKIRAIKAHRERTGADLRESKDAIEAGMTRLYGSDTRPSR